MFFARFRGLVKPALAAAPALAVGPTYIRERRHAGSMQSVPQPPPQQRFSAWRGFGTSKVSGCSGPEQIMEGVQENPQVAEDNAPPNPEPDLTETAPETPPADDVTHRGHIRMIIPEEAFRGPVRAGPPALSAVDPAAIPAAFDWQGKPVIRDPNMFWEFKGASSRGPASWRRYPPPVQDDLWNAFTTPTPVGIGHYPTVSYFEPEGGLQDGGTT